MVATAGESGGQSEIFVLPVLDRALLFAPLHNVVALLSRAAVDRLRRYVQDEAALPNTPLASLADRLKTPQRAFPTNTANPTIAPLFLGIIPTRGCNMGCRYCDFAAPKKSQNTMSLALARSAVDAYFSLLTATDERHAEVQFFGGEPFVEETLVRFVVGYSRYKAEQTGRVARFQVTTNGLHTVRRSRWIAEQFDTVVLSLDGPAAVHDLHRPTLNGQGTFATVARTAATLADGPGELIIRACVTDASMSAMPEMAEWLGRSIGPSAVCFESLSSSPTSARSGFKVPEPYAFARYFDRAARTLQKYGIRTVSAMAEIDAVRATFCPVGKDALIVSPDGAVDACYLLPEAWQARGLAFRFGHVDVANARFELDESVVRQVRQYDARSRPLCRHCFCRLTCAGGCMIHHDTSVSPSSYGDLCIQTRLITMSKLLHRLGQADLAAQWLASDPALEATALNDNDRLLRVS